MRVLLNVLIIRLVLLTILNLTGCVHCILEVVVEELKSAFFKRHFFKGGI